MTYRVFSVLVAVLALALLAAAPTLAQNQAQQTGTHEGTVVKAGDNKLTMTDKAGKNEHSHDVAKDAKITCDGKDCKLDDLKRGYPVKVTVEKRDNKPMATKIEARKSGN
jgi:hypothetical protein